MPNLAWLLISSPLCFFCIKLLITSFIFCHQNRMALFCLPTELYCAVLGNELSQDDNPLLWEQVCESIGASTNNRLQAFEQIHLYPFWKLFIKSGEKLADREKAHQIGLVPWQWKCFLLPQREWPMRNLITRMHFGQPIQPLWFIPQLSLVLRIYRATVKDLKNRTD